jgi:hypothetical protein
VVNLVEEELYSHAHTNSSNFKNKEKVVWKNLTRQPISRKTGSCKCEKMHKREGN